MNDMAGGQLVPHVLGFVRGCLRFGGTPQTIRIAVEKEFPRLNPVQVDELMAGGMTYQRPQA